MSKPYVLVIDDEPDIRQLVKEILEDEGCQVAVARDGEQARQALHERRPDLVLLDIWMPDIDGITFFKEHLARGDDPPVIVMSGHGTVETAVEATRLGAYAFLEKPLSLNKLLPAVEGALATSGEASHEEAGAARRPVTEPRLIGKSSVMQHLRDLLGRIAQHAMPVLMYGENGSGRCNCARYLHFTGGRRQGHFVELHIGAVPENSMEAMLFGRNSGADAMEGALERAAGGTLYLSDVELLPRGLQARLVNFVHNGEFLRSGTLTPVRADVRLVCATTQDLDILVQKGEFREDLYYQLKGVFVHVPSLRDHGEDLPELLKHFVDTLVEQEHLPYRHFTLPVQNRLRHYHWPGNIAELANLVRQALITGSGEEILLEDIESLLHPVLPRAESFLSEMFAMPLRDARDRFEKVYLEYHLQQEGGSVGKVAKNAGMERTHLYRKLRSLGIEIKQGK